MCGITGFIDPSGIAADELTRRVRSMTATLEHRGPDDSGVWSDPTTGIALGFRRLAILDLSPTGSQPMTSSSGRYRIVYNGEIYNYRELREELLRAGRSFRGASDTEVLVEAIDALGLATALRHANGMFALAVWDERDRRLSVARDRLGIKPLYYGWCGDAFLFGSELKAIHAHPSFHPDVDRDVLALYLRHSCVPAPHSIYRGIHKLPPGTIVEAARDAQPQPYWSLAETVAAGTSFEGTEQDAVDQLDELMWDAVRKRMVSDVPLGAFLSGGIDSSLIVALMQAQGDRPIQTFTIGFEEQAYNEANYAAAVARHLGTDHTECYVTPQQARDVIPHLPTMFDEPFGDSSQIPTYLVSQLARRHVTVSLSGDGGDELFGGYNRYAHIAGIWRKLRRVPRLFRPWALRLRQMIAGGPPLSRAELRGFATAQSTYTTLHAHWRDPAAVVIGGSPAASIFDDHRDWAVRDSFIEQMMHLDTRTYLPDDILTKVDRASMAVSLEARIPLLDHRVVEFAWSLPLSIRVASGKRLLREVLDRYVPSELIDRPKVGFGVPIAAWLRGPLRDWAEDLLCEQRLHHDGYFHPAPIREKWQQHLAGTHNWHYWLWDVLMFQQWYGSHHHGA